MSSAYSVLRKIDSFQKKHLPMIQSFEDYTIAVEIGYYQEIGKPLTLKQLFLLEIASPATVQRRLKRLINQGLVSKKYRQTDGRMVELGVTPQMNRLFRRYAGCIRKSFEIPKGGAKTVTGDMNQIGGRESVYGLITMNRLEPVCGTCAHWDGARDVQQDDCRFVADSEGICNLLAEKGRDFVDTITLSTHRPICGDWTPCGG
jgi:hypothetical protein